MFKPSTFPNLGLSWIFGVGPVWWLEVLISCSCWMTIDDHTRFLATYYIQIGAFGVITGVTAGVGDRWDHVFRSHPGVSWTNWTLEACFRGFWTQKNPRCGATGVYICSDYVMHCDALIVVVTIACFTPHVSIYGEANTMFEI